MNIGFGPLALWNGTLGNRLSGLIPELWEGAPARTGFDPAMDVAEDADAFRIAVELPGFSEKEVEVTFEEGVVTIRGERRPGDEGNDRRYHCVERRSGAFERSIRLPGAIDGSKVAASMKNGVLTVTLPKHEEAKPRTVQIRAE